MSKKKNRLGKSVEVIGGIADRLNSEAKKKNNPDEEENKEEEKETNKPDKNENKDDFKYKNIEPKTNSNMEISQNTKQYDASDDNNQKDSWFEEQKPYRSSFIVKPKMEINFEDCKRKFRRELRMNLSKQNAIEIGWLLLKNLDDSFFDEVRKNSSPDDDLVEALKEVIKEYY